jgi:hypothetical protein
LAISIKIRKKATLMLRPVRVHKYSIPYTQEFYGYMYKYAVPYMTPLYGHKYYLLNCSQRQSDAYMNFYYNNKAKERREPFNEFFIKERQKHQKRLCVNEDEIRSFKVKSELQMKEMTQTESRDYWQEFMESFICFERFMREREIIAVKFGKRFSDEEQSVTERELNNVTKIAEFFTEKGYSLLDVLIRCSTEHTTISTTGFVFRDLELHLILYSLLWKIMEKAGLLRNLI